MEMETILEPAEGTELTALEEGQAYLPNQSVLEKLSVDENGDLLFDGVKLVKERKTAVWEADNALENGLILGDNPGGDSITLDIEPGIIPLNAEIKSIEIKTAFTHDYNIGVNEDGFIDLREINSIDNYGIAAVNYHRAVLSDFYSDNSQFLCSILTDDTTGTPEFIYDIMSYDAHLGIRVTYYVEEAKK